MRLSREKQRQLLLVVLGTAAMLAGVWFGLARPQRMTLAKVQAEIEKTRQQIAEAKRVLGRANHVMEELDAAAAALEECEKQMVSGDYYAQMISRIRQFRIDYAVDIPQFSTAQGPVPVDLLPRFPYPQVSMTIAGSGYYHDIGRFLADFENRHPYWQLRNLELEPAGSTDREGAGERLSFRVTVVCLVRPGG